MLRRAAITIAGKGLKGQLLRAGAGGLGVRILSLLSTLLSSVILARALGDDSYGLYVFALSIAALLALPVQVGIPTLVIREIAIAVSGRDWVAFHSIRAWAVRVNVVFGFIVVSSVLLFTWVAGNRLSQDIREVSWLAATLILPLALTSTYSATLRGLNCVVSGLYPSEVLRPILVGSLVGALACFSIDEPSAEIALAVNLASTVLVLALLMLLFNRAIPMESQKVAERNYKTPTWLKTLLPLAMMSSLHMINQNTDLIMLGFFREPAEIGHYKIAVSGAGFVIFGLSAVQVVAMPYISRFFTEKEHYYLQRLASASAASSFLLALPVAAIYLFWGRELLVLVYGHSFVASWEPMLILAAAQLVNAFFGIVWPLLVMTGHEQTGFRALAFASVANIALNATLIPFWGTVGAATATGFSILLWNVLFWVAVHRHLGIDGSMLGLLRQRGRARYPGR